MQAVRAPLLGFDALYRGEIFVLKGLPSVSALVTERQVGFVSVSTIFERWVCSTFFVLLANPQIELI
jgi:hypothetical protein